MNATRVLRASHYQPMIKFVGKHRPPPNVSHAPHAHPAAPTESLPDSFATYRAKAQSHGPLGGGTRPSSAPSLGSSPYGASASAFRAKAGGGAVEPIHSPIGVLSGRTLGSVQPRDDEAMDRSQLPARFARLKFTPEEIEAVESGGATMW